MFSSRWGRVSWPAILLCNGPAKPSKNAPWDLTVDSFSPTSGATRSQRTQHLGHCCLQESLLHLHAPAVLLFFHLLPSVTTLWVMHQLQTATTLSLGPFTARSFRGSLVPITLYGVQVKLFRKSGRPGARRHGRLPCGILIPSAAGLSIGHQQGSHQWFSWYQAARWFLPGPVTQAGVLLNGHLPQDGCGPRCLLRQRTLPQCSPSCLQGLLLFAALLQGSLWLALAVSALAVPLLQSALHMRQGPTAAAPAAAAMTGVLGLALTGGAALSAGPRAAQGLALILLALWGALAAARLAWGHILREPTAVVDLAGGHSGHAGGRGIMYSPLSPPPL